MSVTESTALKYTQLDPDVRLMLEVRDDNGAAFEELVRRYQSRLIHILEHLVRKREHAEDLAQEVFLRVYKARKSYEPGAKFSTWLFTIANNVAWNALRNMSRRKEVNIVGSAAGDSGENALEQMALAASGFMPSKKLDRAELADVVRLAIQSLSDRQRTALLLCKFEHMSYQEIAQTMDLSTKAVKSLLARARVNLRTLLEPYMQEDANR